MVVSMLKDKKGQWARAAARERRSQDRRERLGMTKELLKQGLKADDIAYKLGVSGLTVRQYIREVGHVADAEQNIDTLRGRISSLKSQMNGLSGKKGLSNLKHGIKLGTDALNLMIQVKQEMDVIGEEFDSKEILSLIEALYSCLYSTAVSSVYSSFLSEENKKEYSNEEKKEFKKYFDKWNKGLILEEDYNDFLELAKNLAERKVLTKLPKLIDRIEKKMSLQELVQHLDEKIKPILKEFDLSPDDIRKSGVNKKWSEILISARKVLLISGLVIMIFSLGLGLILVCLGMVGFILKRTKR